MKLKLIPFIMGIGFYFAASLIASEAKVLNGHCGKTYPIDYVIYTDWFCEIKEKSDERM